MSDSTWSAALGLKTLDGGPATGLEGRVWLVVNVASHCGFTPQYEGLEALQRELGGPSFTVIGVPCNQFGAQEPGSPDEIAKFCETRFGVTFPLLEKQAVNGEGRSPLYRHLVGEGPDIRWNFEKFVVDAAGRVTARFGSRVRPESFELREAIAAAMV
jgi:glutathione peroxidase